MRLENTVAVVTGAGSGMGRRTSELFAEHGASIVAADIDEEGAEETVARIDADGGEAVAVGTDVSDPGDVESMVEEAVETFGGIDVLYNNAGIPQVSTPIEEIDMETWEQNQAVNLKSVFLGAKYAAPHLREEGGVILNQSSVAALRPRSGLSAYVAAKGGVLSLTKGLAYELADDDVRVNAICPGPTDTDMLPQFTSEGLSMEEYRSSVPMGRLLETDDIADAALFLASDDAEMITGIALVVDGGRII